MTGWQTIMEAGDGDPMWLATAVDVRDVARAHILAGEKSGVGSRYLVARSHPLPPGDVVESLRKVLPGYQIDNDDVAKRGFYNRNFQIFDTTKVSHSLLALWHIAASQTYLLFWVHSSYMTYVHSISNS